jgi:outer membrane protein assembly factor BamE (lipoprotein component of BamABCDE complex)
MKATIVTLLAAAAGIVVAQLPATAQNRVSSEDEGSHRQQQLAPAIGHVAVRATLLHWGMPQADIARVMGAPSQVAAADDEGTVRVLKYSAEPIATTVTITDGKLSGVALDVAGIDDPALPNFARAAWLGMDRATVLRILGMPAENHLRHCDGMNVEQMIFERPAGPDVSIFLIDGRVAAKKVGRPFPADVLGFALPLAADPADDESDEIADQSKNQLVAVGMKESELRALFGAPKLQTSYTFRGQAAEHAIYEMSPGKSFGCFTLIDGVVIDFADGGYTSLNQILDGR